MMNLFKRIWNDKTGNVLVVAGASLPMVIGAAGLATDTIQWTLWKRQLQRAADSAAIAGVYQRVQTGSDEDSVEGAIDRDLELNNHVGIDMNPTYPQFSLPADDGDKKLQVAVTLEVSRPLSFSGMFMSNPPAIRATATAASTPGSDKYCVVSLETTSTTGITGSGDGEVEMDCGMITNSTAANSAIAKGSSKMKATVIASVGGIQASDNWEVDKYDPYVSELLDPYKDVTPDPSDMRCNAKQTVKIKGVDTVIYGPIALDESTDVSALEDINGDPINCFSSISVSPGTTLTLPSGGPVYVNGGDVNIQGKMTGTDVTVVLTNTDPSTTATIGDFDMNAQGELYLTSPTSGTYDGIAVYQDRRATNSDPNKINGGSKGEVIGALYFPNQGLTYNGDGNTAAVCTRFVTRRITFSGSSTLSNKFAATCTGGSDRETYEGGRLIRLVA